MTEVCAIERIRAVPPPVKLSIEDVHRTLTVDEQAARVLASNPHADPRNWRNVPELSRALARLRAEREGRAA